MLITLLALYVESSYCKTFSYIAVGTICFGNTAASFCIMQHFSTCQNIQQNAILLLDKSEQVTLCVNQQGRQEFPRINVNVDLLTSTRASTSTRMITIFLCKSSFIDVHTVCQYHILARCPYWHHSRKIAKYFHHWCLHLSVMFWTVTMR